MSSLRSMTGFAEARAEENGWTLRATVKSVNHRFLDIRWQCPPGFEAAVHAAEKLIRERARRGHLDVRIQLESTRGAALQLDTALVDAYLCAHRELCERLQLPSAPPEPSDLLRVPGVFNAEAAAEAGDAEVERLLLKAIALALDGWDEMRESEGAALARDLRMRLDLLERARRAVAADRPAIEAAIVARLKERMTEIAGNGLPAERVLQEAALLAERSDVSEELVRLETHFTHCRELLKTGGEAGKKLDFLLQEMNREVNTLLSKTTGASGLPITAIGLEMKAELEKMREQTQNLE